MRWFFIVFSLLVFISGYGQDKRDLLTLLTFNNQKISIKDFDGIDFQRNFNMMDKSKLRENKLKAYQITSPSVINLLGHSGSFLYIIVDHKDYIQDYWFRIEGGENVRKLYLEIYKKYPQMTSYNDGVLRFKKFKSNNEVFEMTINNIKETDIFMDINYTNNYEKTSLNMFKNYDHNIESPLKKVEFKYNETNKSYEIRKVNND